MINGNNVREADRYNDDPQYLAGKSDNYYETLCDDDGDVFPFVDAFCKGYAECMLWTNTYTDTDEVNPDNGYPMVESADVLYMYETPGQWWHDIGIDFSDCIDFLAAMDDNGENVNLRNMRAIAETNMLKPENRYLTLATIEWSTFEQHGHDFALTRNGHGAGFWDRGYPDEIGDALTSAAESYGTHTLYMSNVGSLYND